jgi:hypothetical protein
LDLRENIEHNFDDTIDCAIVQAGVNGQGDNAGEFATSDREH